MNVSLFTPVYSDRLLRLLAIPLLGLLYRHIGEPSPLIALLRDPVYYIDLLVCIGSIGVLWELVKVLIRRLDQYYSWITQFFQRLVIQAIATYAITIFYTLLVTFIYNDIIMRGYRHELYNISFSFVIDVPVSILMITIMQLLYYILYLQAYHQENTSRASTTAVLPIQEPPTVLRKNILAYFGKSLLPVALEDIAYFHKVGEVTLVRTFENQDYRIDQTLEQLQTSVPVNHFYRLNRQIIVNLAAVKEVQNEAGGKLRVLVEPLYQEEVTVSRKKATEFKNWLNG